MHSSNLVAGRATAANRLATVAVGIDARISLVENVTLHCQLSSFAAKGCTRTECGPAVLGAGPGSVGPVLRPGAPPAWTVGSATLPGAVSRA